MPNTVGQTINTVRKRKEISGWCGVLWASFIREKASKNSKKFYSQNDERFYKGRKILTKHEVSILTKKEGGISV